MSKELAGNKDYNNWLSELKTQIRLAQQKAALKVNQELLRLYWYVGNVLDEKDSEWGDKFIDNLARDLRVEFPAVKGFSKRNLENMRRWYRFHESNAKIAQQAVAQLTGGTYNQFAQQLVAQLGTNAVAQLPDEKSQQAVEQLAQGILFSIPWGHHTLILTKTGSPKEAYFYIIQTIRNNWSRSILQLQIEAQLFEKQGSKINNFDLTLPDVNKDLIRETIKSEYNLDFLGLESDMQERDLEKALTRHIRKFLIELGKGFSYVGNQYNIQIANDDFFLDMLFFNINLNCYVVVELKIGDFKPEFAGKLNFYTNVVDETAKLPHHSPTIGILLCKTLNADVIKLSLKGINSPVGVSDYKLTKALRSGLPTKKELQQSLHTDIQPPKNPLEEKRNKLLNLISKAGKEEVKKAKDNVTVHDVVDKVVLGLHHKIEQLLKEQGITELFNSNTITYWIDTGGCSSQKQFYTKLREVRTPRSLRIEHSFDGFKALGTSAFNWHLEFSVELDQYKYIVEYGKNRNSKVFRGEYLYHDIISEKELQKIAIRFVEAFFDEITEHTEHKLNH